MEEKWLSDKVVSLMLILMTLSLVLVAVKPTKIIVLGSANDNHGSINIDTRSRKGPKGGPRRPHEPIDTTDKKAKKKKKAVKRTRKA